MALERVRISPANPEAGALGRAVEVLRAGGIVAYATDTLYGLAVDPRDDDAVGKLFRAKGRPAGMAIPLVAATLAQARAAGVFGQTEMRLAAAFWPGPLTLVVPAAAPLSRLVVAADSSVAVRVPAHPVARVLAAAFDGCITATSANPSGAAATALPEEVAASMAAHVDLLLDSGAAPGGLPSTIVRIGERGPALVRAGAIAWERVLESLQ